VLFVHIRAGTLGLFSGTAAIVFRKGSPRHVLAGKIFVVSMLIIAVCVVYQAIVSNKATKDLIGLPNPGILPSYRHALIVASEAHVRPVTIADLYGLVLFQRK
jgi:hypothetical protein